MTITTKEALEFKDLATREVFFEKVQEKKKKANRQTLLLTATQHFRALPPEDEDEDVDEGDESEEAEEGVKEPCGHALCFFQDFDCIFPESAYPDGVGEEEELLELSTRVDNVHKFYWMKRKGFLDACDSDSDSQVPNNTNLSL